jgi:tRNA threonylcarbamoyl adenosine modification protein YeaZ
VLVVVIDTSSAAVTAAVAEVDGAQQPIVSMRAQRVTINPRGHGELLAPSVRSCLADAGAGVGDLGAIVAGLGPGPFTGLRVGLVTAAVLADTLGVPAYGVCSLDAIGHACADEAELLVATEARRHEVYWARYRHGRRSGEPQVSRPADIDTAGVTAVAGVGAGQYDFGVPVRAVDHPPPHSLAALAADRAAGGAAGEVLVPLYLRRPDAVANLAPKPVSQ